MKEANIDVIQNVSSECMKHLNFSLNEACVVRENQKLQVSQYHCAPYASEQGFLNTLCTMLPRHTNKASSTLIVFLLHAIIRKVLLT
jgi:hypothetical protein